MTAYLMVRAQVPDADHDKFDHWYETEHLPDAKKAFGARTAWRGWSTIEPSCHIAFYEFPDLEAANSITGSDAIKELIKEFDRVWQGRVTRTRDVVDILQTI
jgi:hypothetical protein